jgi:hypothetical protein
VYLIVGLVWGENGWRIPSWFGLVWLVLIHRYVRNDREGKLCLCGMRDSTIDDNFTHHNTLQIDCVWLLQVNHGWVQSSGTFWNVLGSLL